MKLYVNLSKDPLSIPDLMSRLESDGSVGGVSIFSGVTRNFFGDRSVVSLSYEAYEEMALKKMQELAETAMREMGVSRVGIEHRLGEVPVGEASVNIVTMSSHR